MVQYVEMISVRAGFVIFTLVFGIIAVLLIVFLGIDPPYSIGDLVVLGAIILLFAILTAIGALRKKRI